MRRPRSAAALALVAVLAGPGSWSFSSSSSSSSSSSAWAAAAAPPVSTWAVGPLGVPGPMYQYGPTIALVGETYVAMYCSPGGNGAWDYIRMSSSPDLKTWTTPQVALAPQTPYEADSVCDPSLVRFRGVWFLYHTCINTKTPPDGYTNNRICLALADEPMGPFYSLATPVVQDLDCPKDPNAAYCVGQPSAVVAPDLSGIILFYTNQNSSSQPGPNPGFVFAVKAEDGVNFQGPPAFVFNQRDVDVKYDHASSQFVLVQGDVGSTTLTWASSPTWNGGWPNYNVSRAIATNPDLPAGGSNNNPGLVGRPDGSFSGQTSVVYGSSFQAGWGDWSLYRSDLLVDPAHNDCSQCVANSCDFGCRPNDGVCSVPGSKNPADCCDCVDPDPDPGCNLCAPGGCVAACRAAGYAAGVCGAPGSSNPSDCCSCFH